MASDNQSITMNTNEILGDNDDTRFFTEVHLLASKLVPVVTITQLGGSRANRHHTPNPQRMPHNQHKMRTLDVTSNVLVTFCELPRGIGARTPHNHIGVSH